MGSNTARYPSRRTLGRQAPPRGICASTYDPLRGVAICKRLAAGESLRSICRADVTMPTEKTVWNWRRAHREFAAIYQHAVDTARAASLAAQAAADAARRRERAAARKAPGRTGRPSLWWDDLEEMILWRLLHGDSLAAICRQAWAPSVGTIYNRLRRDTGFLERYRSAKAAAADMMVTVAAEDTPWQGGEAASNRLLDARLKAASRRAAKIVPKRYATAQGPGEVNVLLEGADGSYEVIYGACPAGRPPRPDRGMAGSVSRPQTVIG